MTTNILKPYFYDEQTKSFLNFYSNKLTNPSFEPGILKMTRDNVRGRDGLTTFDEVNEYMINSNGFRGQEFLNKKIDILGAGCSVTFGIGVPEDGTWVKLLSSMQNKSAVNISLPGSSVSEICNKVIKYCMNYGNPNSIYCLFPDFFRMLFVQDFDYDVAKKYINDINTADKAIRLSTPNIANTASYLYEDGQDKILIERDSKEDRSLENSISPHQAILESINSIYFLESFCKTNNIKLYWSTWSNITKILINTLNTIKDFELTCYTAFDEVENKTYNPNNIVSKCKLSHDSDFTSHPSWKEGSDFMANNNKIIKHFMPHPGIHFHHHVAEMFNSMVDE